MQLMNEGAASYPKRKRQARVWGGLGLLSLLPLVASAPGCQTTPVTGSTHFNLLSIEDDVNLGREAYSQTLSGENLVVSGPQYEMVQRIMSRIVAVADDPGYEWEVSLIKDDETVNAFALPGGKMAVYTGIIPVAQSEAGLAVVMGHEIGHVVARHGTARVSRAMGIEVVLALVNAGDYAELARSAAGLLTLPFSRADESEADHIGLIYMARAGYDPREATGFWERMDELSGDGPPEFLSTHPSHETRVSRLQELMPEALAEYAGP